MRTSRRNFLKSAAASASLAAFPRIGNTSSYFFADDSLQAKLASDPLRPQFHLLPAKNWMNDPNGPIFWNGKYHMFFQYNPNAAVWGDMHWNHAVSDDMIHWKHLPIALAPTPGWADADGCFTGSAVNDNGVATILYTGVKTVPKEQATLSDGNHNYRETQCLATSRDPQLLKWEKWKEPVIEPPNDPKLAGFRDPFLWQDEKSKLWYLGVASGQFKVGGRVLLYRSKDLRNWEYLHTLASGHWREKENSNPVDSGEMWECPDFFPLGKKHVLLYSTAGQVFWEVGELDPKELVFHMEKRGVLDHGAYYAQKTQLDAKGNRILWGWIPERRPDSELIAAGWAGCMALPRLLTIGPYGQLQMSMAPQAYSLREKQLAQSPSGISAERPNLVARVSIENLCGELRWLCATQRCSFVLEDKTGPWLAIEVAPKDDSAAIVTVNTQKMEIPYDRLTKAITFHLILDASVSELICNTEHCITTRIYRQPNGPLRFRTNDDLFISSSGFETWQWKPISKDRLTT
jgi:beta-fructofuranosidase